MSITQHWLAQGNRFDDLDLWDKLCHYLDLQPGKAAYLRDIPTQYAPLLYDSQGARRQRETWDAFELCPVFFLRERGWCLHTDWSQRLDLLKQKDPNAVASHLSIIVTKRESKFIKRVTTGKTDIFVCDLCRARGATVRAITHLPSCLIAELRARIVALRAGKLAL
jgi:hypothetical protein